MSPTECDVLVLGIGGMGSAATYHLARRGYDVVGIERYDIPHSRGSSHGLTRIIRLPQYEEPSYVPLVRRAYTLWRELDAEHPRQLFHQVGSLDIGPADHGAYVGSKRACQEYNIQHEDLGGEELNKRFPGYAIPQDYRAVYQPDGGFLHCEQCTIAHVEAAHAEGATIRARETVEEWEANESGVRVRTDRTRYTADRMVVTAGAWTGHLLPSLSHLLEPQRQVLGWFQPEKPCQYHRKNFPVFVADVEEGHFYGFPQFEVPGMKIGKYQHRNETGTPAELAREPDRRDEELLREFTDQYCSSVTGPTVRLSICMFTNTPDEEFIIDTHPDHENITVGAGFSGRGFKFASVVGELLADVVQGTKTSVPTEAFRIDRFDR